VVHALIYYEYLMTSIQQLCELSFQVIIASPEMYLQHAMFWKMLTDQNYHKYFSHIVVDEVHCIQWGQSGFQLDWACHSTKCQSTKLKLNLTSLLSSIDLGRGLEVARADSNARIDVG
jgi:hypothetical protein